MTFYGTLEFLLYIIVDDMIGNNPCVLWQPGLDKPLGQQAPEEVLHVCPLPQIKWVFITPVCFCQGAVNNNQIWETLHLTRWLLQMYETEVIFALQVTIYTEPLQNMQWQVK